MATEEAAETLALGDDPAGVRAYIEAGGDTDALRSVAERHAARAVLFELAQLLRGQRGASTDTPRVEVRLQAHPVFLGRDHAYLAVVSRGHPFFDRDPRFRNGAEGGARFCTLGAGPKHMIPIFGTLVSDLNRLTDVSGLLPDTYDAELQHPAVLAGRATEREAIEALFAADGGYCDKLDYDPVPWRWSDGYNSNSYIAGLLAATGWRAEKPPSVPGWNKPLPPGAFGLEGAAPFV
jgi:hypothetical protein